MCLLAACLVSPAGAEQGADDEIRLLKATVKMQAAQIRSLKAENAALRAKVDQLRALCRKAGVEPEPPAATRPGTTGVTYLGKKRTAYWLEAAYKRHSDKIAFIDGRYVDIGEAALKRTTVSEEAPAAGDVYRVTPAGSQVQNILGPKEIIIHRPGLRLLQRDVDTGGVKTILVQPLLYHVTGVDTSRLTVGKFFGGKLLHTGAFTYGSTDEPMSMQSYRPYTPLTREQFADALAKGFRLFRYSRSGKEITRIPVN